MDSRCSPDYVAYILEVDGYLMPHEDHIPLALGIVETASEVSAHLVEDNHISILRLFFKILDGVLCFWLLGLLDGGDKKVDKWDVEK